MSYPLLDLYAVMQNVPTIMGLDLKYYKDAWQGAYYMNGERHAYKKDKLKVKLWRGSKGCSIFVFEQGGQSVSLATWLTMYGGAADYKEAYDIMRGNAIPKAELLGDIRRSSVETRYVTKEQYEEYRQYELERCPLYSYMCRLFGEQKVREAFDRYNVTTDFHGNAVFWVVDVDGNICHDKRIKYKYDGKRDKNFGAMRKYKVGDGYNSHAYFGSHLIQDGETINVTESEKSCLYGYLYYGGIWLSCGGKNNLRDVEENMVLYPDLDAVDYWSQKGTIAEWWCDDDAKELGDNADVGDLIVEKRKKELGIV